MIFYSDFHFDVRASIYFLKRFFSVCFSLWCLTAFETLLSSLCQPRKREFIISFDFFFLLLFFLFLLLRTRKIEFGSTSRFNWFVFNPITLKLLVDHCRHDSTGESNAKTHYASFSSATKPEQNKVDSFDLTEKKKSEQRDDESPNSKLQTISKYILHSKRLLVHFSFTPRHRSYRGAHTNQKLNRDRKLLEQMTYHLKR